MSYDVINNSPNPLQLSDGTMLAPVGAKGSKRVLETIDRRDKSYVERGWVSIFEKLEKEDAPAGQTTSDAKTEPKTDGGNKTK